MPGPSYIQYLLLVGSYSYAAQTGSYQRTHRKSLLHRREGRVFSLETINIRARLAALRRSDALVPFLWLVSGLRRVSGSLCPSPYG
ncbi:hypothetical protein CPC08DRAFT_712772 [Agrocybe pediades]|nr:hypothetical protein CPC08DRAFT_712772 [Agrocybe pediades]